MATSPAAAGDDAAPTRTGGTSITVAGTGGAGAEAAGGRGVFANCTAFNDRWEHGVGKRRARDRTSGDPVTDFLRSNRIYAKAMRKNDDLDRDGDHIACESH
jgi:hypothetical protein